MAKKSFSVVKTRRSSGGQSVINQIKENLQIIPELKDLIPPLQQDEFEQLKANIEKEGVREPIMVWEFKEGKYAIVDGHNRFRCIEEIGKDSVSWSVKRVEFSKIEAVREWMINNQLGRRNLTDIARAMLIAEKYELIKKGKGKEKTNVSNKQNLLISEKPKSPYKKLAEETGRSERTIINDVAIAKGLKKLDKKDREQVISGEKKMKKGDLVKLGKEYSKKPSSNKQNLLISEITDGIWIVEINEEKEVVRVQNKKVERWGVKSNIDLNKIEDSINIKFKKKIKI